MKPPFGKPTVLVRLASAFFFTAILMRFLLADVFHIVMELTAFIPFVIAFLGAWLLKKSVSIWKSNRVSALTTAALALFGVCFHIFESEESINEIRFWLLKSKYEQKLKVINEAIALGKSPSDFRLVTAYGIDDGPPVRVVFPLRHELFSDRWHAVANDPTGKILRANEPGSGGYIAPLLGDRRHFVSARHISGDWYLCTYLHSDQE